MVKLTTLLYEGNYKKILNSDSWFLNYSSSKIDKKIIVVNNVNNRKEIEQLIEHIKNNYSNIEYFFVEDYEKEAIEYFNLDIDKNSTLGYYYIIPYFAIILHINSGFFLHVSEDCTNNIVISEDYISASVEEISTNNRILVTTIGWGIPKQSNGYDVGEWEEIETFRLKNKKEPNSQNFWHSIGFVDQVFMANAEKLKMLNYNIQTYDNPIYHGPWYCPNSWERRVAEYMYKNDVYRGVWKNCEEYYIHPGHSL